MTSRGHTSLELAKVCSACTIDGVGIYQLLQLVRQTFARRPMVARRRREVGHALRELVEGKLGVQLEQKVWTITFF